MSGYSKPMFNFLSPIFRLWIWMIAWFLAVLMLLPAVSMATVRAPVSVTIASGDELVVGREMRVIIVLEAFKDLPDVKFDLIVPTQGWTFLRGQDKWAGELKAGAPVEFEVYVIPTEESPEPLMGRVRVPGWPDAEGLMDMGRLGGRTPEKGIIKEVPPGVIPPEVPGLRPEGEEYLPKPSIEKPTEPRIPGRFKVTDMTVAQGVTEQGIGELATVRAYGRIVYYDDGSNMVGLRHGLVQLMDDDPLFDDECTSALTDASGYFDLTGSCGDGFPDDDWGNANPDIYIKASAISGAVEVKPGGIFAGTYTAQTSTTSNFSGTEKNYGTLDVPDDGAYHLYSVGVSAWQYMLGQGSDVPMVVIRWPDSDWPNYNGEVHMPSGWEWGEDTLVHEYGHHVLGKLAESPWPDYNNGICDDPTPGHCIWAPEKGAIAWTEGWPNFLSAVVTRAYSYNNNMNFESHPVSDPYSGQEDFIEGYIAAILWDLYDSADDDQHGDGAGRRDRLSLGFDEQWDVILNYDPPGGNSHPVSIHQFWDGMRARWGGYQNLLSEVYLEHHISKPQPDLITSSLSDPPSTAQQGSSFWVTSTVTNSGNDVAISSSTVRYYLSTNTTITSSDWLLWGSRTVPANLASGSWNTASNEVTIPGSLTPGTYYLGACADDLSNVPESNEGNNCRASTNTIQVTTPPDLVMTALTGPDGESFDAGQSFSIDDTVQNQGGTAAGSFRVRFFLSTDAAISLWDIPLTPDRIVSSLAGGASSSGTTTVTIPAAVQPGTYYVGACADVLYQVAESNEGNNCRVDGTIEVVSSTVMDVSITSSNEKNPDAAYNSTGNQFLTVLDSGGSIIGEIRGADGTIVKDNFGILFPYFNICGLSYYSEPAVTYKSSQNVYFVVAKSVKQVLVSIFPFNCDTKVQIVAQRVVADGSLLGTEIGLSGEFSTAVALDGRPDVVADTYGSNCCILTVWKQAELIMGQQLNGDGTLYGSNFTITDAFPGTVAPTPAVTYQRYPNDDFLVVYKVFPELASPYIARRIVQYSGTVSVELTISDAGAEPSDPDVSYNENSDTYLAVWNNGSIIGQRLDAAGSKVGANFVINPRPCIFLICGSTGDPAVAATTDTPNFLVAYYQTPASIKIKGGTDRDLLGVRVDSTGGVGSEFAIFYDTGLHDQNPAMVYGTTPKRFMVAWEHESVAGGTYDVYGKLLAGLNPPDLPTGLGQFKSDGTTSLTTGAWTGETTVVLKFNMSDPNNPDTLIPEVEIRPIGTAFTGSPTHTGSPVAYTGTAIGGVITVSGLVDGTEYHWQGRVRDAYGQTSAWVSFGGNAESARDVGVDTAVPSGSVSINGGAAYTISTSVILTLMCGDPAPGSGCLQMQVSNDGVFDIEPWEALAGNKAWTLLGGDGTKEVFARFRDRAGNISAVSSDTILLDTTAPSVVMRSPAAGAYVSGLQNVSAGVSDTGSGVAQVELFVGATSLGVDTTDPYTASWNTTLLADGPYDLSARAWDNAGNSATSAKVTVKVDNTAPTGTILINGDKIWTKTASVTLTLTCSDAGSGCAQMQFSNDNVTWEAWEAYAVSRAWTLPAGDGNKTVFVRFKDVAGNISGSFSDSIKLDTTKPVLSGVSDAPDPFKHHLGEVSTISFTLSDNLSGKCKVRAKIYNASNVLVRTVIKTGVNCPAGGAAGSIIWDGRNGAGALVPAGLYTYKLQAQDKALNWSVISRGTTTVE